MADKHVLVIDDDPDVREALRLILESHGYEVTLCATGPEGRDAATSRPPDVILLDIMLSSVSEGFHIAYDFRKDERLAGIPIIMISSIDETMGMDYAKELGSEYLPADSFLNKPLQATTVIAALEEALARGGEPSNRPG